MIRMCLLLISTVAALSSFAQKFQIVGHISHLPNQWVSLSYMDDSLHTRIDSAYSTEGIFRFIGKIAEPTAAGLFSADGTISITFFFEAGNTEITGDTSQPENLLIRGGNSTKNYAEFRAIEAALYQQNDSLKDLAFRHSTDQAEFQKYWNRYEEAAKAAEQKKERWMLQHKDAEVNAYLLLYHYIDIEKLAKGDSLLKLMSDKVQHCKYARNREVAKYTITLRKTGKPVINFAQNDTAGRSVSTKMFSGKYFLIDFWASWCKPCRDLSPALVQTYRKYHSKGFEIISVSLDNSRSNWLKAIAEDSLVWTQVSELKVHNSAAELYDVEVLPANFLVDKNGIVIDEYLWGDRLNDRLEELFEE